MDLAELARFALGLVLLVAGAEALVRGASRLAAALGLSPLVIGLTVVAAGTSAPELAVSVDAAWRGQGDIAAGNVVGSNVFNILCILGLCALVVPLRVSSQLVRTDVPILIAASLLVLPLSADGALGRADGLFLVGGLVAYVWYSIVLGRRDPAGAAAPAAPAGGGGPLWLQALWIAAGLALLVLGARWLVEGAVAIARLAGLSELVIGLTVVAAGTSLPELATSVIGSLRGERDIAVGNAIGSCIFNLLGILGAAALVAGTLPVAPALRTFDLPVMIATALACLPIFVSGHCISRLEGGIFFAYYVAYTAYLVLAASAHDALPAFSHAMLAFAVPLTIITLVIVLLRERAAPGEA